MFATIFYKSRAVQADLVPDIVAKLRIAASGNDIVVYRDFLDREQLIDATHSFTGATDVPVSFANHDLSMSDRTVSVTKQTEILDTTSLGKEVEKTVDEIIRYNEEGFDTKSTFGFAHPSLTIKTRTGVKFSKSSQSWKFSWHLYNRYKPLVETTEHRLELGRAIISAFEESLGNEGSYFSLDGPYLEFHQSDGSRIVSSDFSGIDDPRTEQSLYIDFDLSETAQLLNGLHSLINKLGLKSRVVHKTVQDFDKYEQWLTAFEHRSACYGYLFQGHITESVANYFHGLSTPVPQGFVPFAEYRIGSKGAKSITVALNFLDEHAFVYVSANENVKKQELTRYMELSGLVEFIDESCLYHECQHD